MSSVEYTVEITEEADPETLKRLVREELEKMGIKPKKDRGERRERRSPGRKEDGDLPVERPNEMVSHRGDYPIERRRYRYRKDDRPVPEGSSAPFNIGNYITAGFGGSEYVPPTGFKFHQVNRQGNVRRGGVTSPAFPGMDQSFVDRMNRNENDIRSLRQQLFGSPEATAQRFGRVSGTAGQVGTVVGGVHAQEAVVGGIVMRMLSGAGPFGIAAVAAITAAVSVPEIAKQIIKLLGVKGAPLNRDFTILVDDLVQTFFDAEERRRRLLGIDAFIASQVTGFQPADGSPVYNSLESRDEVIISKIGDADRALGIDY